MTRLSPLLSFLVALPLMASSALAITVTVPAGTSPESITAAPDGGVILGASRGPFIYRAAKGETVAKLFIDASADGTVTFLGVLADAPAKTLWACEMFPFTAPDGSPSRRSELRGYDLDSGAAKFRWPLPGAVNGCNDFVVGPDKALYVSDTPNGIVYRVKPGASAGEVVISNDRVLKGVDGLAFVKGELYVNNVAANTLWRIPMDASGKAGAPVHIWTDKPIKAPDGMRAMGDKLFLAENRGGNAVLLTIEGDIAHVTVLQSGLGQPTAIEPAGDSVWVNERLHDRALTLPMPK